MKNTLRMLIGATLAMLSFIASAEAPVFESCLDSHGRTIPAQADARLPVLVQTISQKGRPAIRYNPEILPQLSTNARLFFYAHQCARQGSETAASARRADCLALNTLLGSDQLKYKDLPALQAELKFSDEDWSLLPGPARNIDLSNCRPSSGDVLRLPLPSQPSPEQNARNTCVRACADTLWTCQKGRSNGATDDCLGAYDQCRSGCGN